jgi:hypothetical protein
VVTIQRWFRREVWLPVWDRAAAGFAPRIRKAGTVRIVEPSGQQYYFLARDLALMFVASATSANPVTRRQLLPSEMKRVGNCLPPRLRVLFLHTLKHQEDTARAARQEDSLVSFLHAAAGTALDLAFAASEIGGTTDADLHDLLDDYEHAVMDVATQCPTSVRGLLKQHCGLMVRRARCCDPRKIGAIAAHLEFLNAQYAGPGDLCGAELPSPAFVNWILEAVR